MKNILGETLKNSGFWKGTFLENHKKFQSYESEKSL